MLFPFQNQRASVAAVLSALITVICGVAAIATAQDQPASEWEIFGGYSFFYPGADVHGTLPGASLPVASRLESNPRGAGASVTYNFNRWLGLTSDLSGSLDSDESTTVQRIDDAFFFNASLGPKLTLRSHYFSPFLEGLVGWHRLTSDVFRRDDRVGFMAGGGIDLNLNRHFALRLVRADFVISNHHFGSGLPATEVRGARAQSGVVFLFGGRHPEAPVSASCSTNSSEVMVGEPLSATATGSNFNSFHHLNYTWSSTSGNITGHEDTANIDTNGLASGSYTVTAQISDAKVKDRQATCSASFRVKQPPRNPPTMSCSANPSTVQPGMSSAIGCTCSSADSVPITVSGWTASAGSLSGSDNTAALNTSGASAGPITVSAICTDSRGLNTHAMAEVMVENPPVSPEIARLEQRRALHSIYFATAKPTIENPESGLLASQQQTLTSLAEDFRRYLELKPGARLILGGHADPRGSVQYNQGLSERRVHRTERFLVEHGIPAANIETKAFGEQHNLTDAEVKDAVENNPELSAEERQRVLNNMTTIILASNRRVDVTLSTTGQQSVRQFPFNAADSLTLIKLKQTGSTREPMTKRRAKPRIQQ
jgi:outer membrane protein OmpA-like peptidoglycan-associated protein